MGRSGVNRCSTCPGPPFSIVPPSIPTSHSPYLFLGAGPSKRENERLRPYAGQAGEEFDNTYLTAAGMRRENVCVGNARQCWDGTSRTPTGAACLDCARNHIPQLLDRVKPEVVILMGGAAQPLSDVRVKLDMHRGRPRWGSLLNGAWEGWIYSVYEPALGMRETSRMTQLLEDFRNLGRWVRGEWEPPVPMEVEKDYQLIRDNLVDLKTYLRLDCKYDWLAVDTETDGGKPWSVQFSHTFGTGRILMAGDQFSEFLLATLDWWLKETKTEVILHNAPGDLDTLERMGVHVTRWRDTMQEAYHLCSLPQGLKPLAYRLLGVTMRSWEDVVWPASIDAVKDWMEDGIGLATGSLEDVLVTEMKTWTCLACGHRAHGHKHKTGYKCGSKAGGIAPCQCVDYLRVSNRKTEKRPGAVAKILRHILNYTAGTEEEEKPYNPWKALGKMRAEGLRGERAESWEWEYLEGELGPIPILSIANAALPDACEYAIGDADYTGQVAGELERLRGSERWQIDEADVDQ